jgi:hypothetical protein
VLAVLALLLVAAVGVLSVWAAARHVPRFYAVAMGVDQAVSSRGSDRMLQKATALASDLKQGRPWALALAEEEINGWLAVDLLENHRNSIPPGLESPRVHIEGGQLMLACRWQQGMLKVVLWLVVEPYLDRPNAVAVRIVKVRAGRLPLPMQQVLDAISQAAQAADLKIEWRQADADPVAVLSLPPHRREDFSLTALRLSDGKVSLAGTSRPRSR